MTYKVAYKVTYNSPFKTYSFPGFVVKYFLTLLNKIFYWDQQWSQSLQRIAFKLPFFPWACLALGVVFDHKFFIHSFESNPLSHTYVIYIYLLFVNVELDLSWMYSLYMRLDNNRTTQNVSHLSLWGRVWNGFFRNNLRRGREKATSPIL